jgi:hypothetical protein
MGDMIIPMDAEAIREWRANRKPGHTRHAYEFKGPGRGGVDRANPVHDPDQTPEQMDPDRGMDLPPLPGGIAEERWTRDEFERRVLAWVRSAKTPEEKRRIREIVQHRVGILKATSPLQFSHIDDKSLEEQLIATLKAKSQAAVERVYKERGWAGRQNLDLIRSERPADGGKMLLPGQTGRRS